MGGLLIGIFIEYLIWGSPRLIVNNILLKGKEVDQCKLLFT